MSSKRRWISGSLAVAATLLLIMTLIWPRWIEGLFEASPDGGDGLFEVLSVVAFAVLAAIAGTDLLIAWLRSHRTARGRHGGLAEE